jgi:hypothetical protein
MAPMAVHGRKAPRLALCVALALALGEGRAVAQPPASAAKAAGSVPTAPAAVVAPGEKAAPELGSSTYEGPWSQGVPEKERSAADVLFHQGNALLSESICISAAAKYREALRHWDHPNIHYNLALALMNLDQPVETYRHLVAATRYGPAPLQKERYEHAKNYQKLIEQQLARVEIRCAVPRAEVEMNGRRLFVGPGKYEDLVRAGPYTIAARREGFVTNHSLRMLEGGKQAVIDLDLKTMEQLTQYRRRWPAWIPWAVVGTGAAVAIAGGALHYTALQKIDSVDQQSRARCSNLEGCTSEPADLAQERGRANTMQKLAYGAYGVGGAAIVLGGVLAYMNRPHSYVQSYDSDASGPPPRQARLEVVPVLDAGHAGLAVAGRF